MVKRTGSRASLTHYRIVRSEFKASRSHLNSFSKARSRLHLSTSINVLGNDLLQICSLDCTFGSKLWVGIGLDLTGSPSPTHTENMNFGYIELRLTCSLDNCNRRAPLLKAACLRKKPYTTSTRCSYANLPHSLLSLLR